MLYNKLKKPIGGKNMKWETVKISCFNGYKIENNTAFSKAKKMYPNRYPTNSTIEKLKKMGIKQIVYQNGDFITL